jgi:SEC-C motif-containing protein
MSRAAGDSTQARRRRPLSRSRYSAFAVGDTGYLLRTWHPSARPRTFSLNPALRWTRLAVLQTRDGGLFDATGTVQFCATYVQQGQRGVLAETSRFVRHERHWTYLGPTD